MSTNATSTPTSALIRRATCCSRWPNSPTVLRAVRRRVRLLADRLDQLAPHRRCRLPCAFSCGVAGSARTDARGSRRSPRRRSGTARDRRRRRRRGCRAASAASACPTATARIGEAFALDRRQRAIQPAVFRLTPGVPDSMNSCASKCERDGSGEPAARRWPAGRCPTAASAAAALDAARSGRRDRCAPFGALPGAATAMLGRSW